MNHAPKAPADPPRAYTKATYTLKDKGTPSSSLIPKSGLPGDTPTGDVKLIVLFPDVSWEGSSPATRDDDLLWGVIVPTSGLSLPSKENLMHPSETPPTAQDIDIIQVKAIRFSEVLHRTP